MKTITQKEFDKILKNHQHYLNKDCDGWETMCANFENVSLEQVILKEVNLSKAKLINVEIIRCDLCKTDLSDANLINVNLRFSNLEYADLSNADLINVDLNYANLSFANLNYCSINKSTFINSNLSNVNLIRAYIYETNFHLSHLTNANLDAANIRYCNFKLANLNDVSLYSTKFELPNLHETNFTNAKGPLLEYRKGKILTEPITGYKICRDDIIVTLEIPAGAIVFSINGDKCRTNKCKVIKIEGANEAISKCDNNFTYKVGDEIVINNFNLEYNVECGAGIHFFMTKKEAIDYNQLWN